MYIIFKKGSQDQQRAVKWGRWSAVGWLEPAVVTSKRHNLIHLVTTGNRKVRLIYIDPLMGGMCEGMGQGLDIFQLHSAIINLVDPIYESLPKLTKNSAKNKLSNTNAVLSLTFTLNRKRGASIIRTHFRHNANFLTPLLKYRFSSGFTFLECDINRSLL